jgi:hypothetical protein
VGGVQLRTSNTGYLRDFFRVYSSTHMKANVLSFSDMQVLYVITYEPQLSFTVNLPGKDIVFNRRNKLYGADLGTEEGTVLVTQPYLKAEEARAKEAYELIKNFGYPSYQEAIHLIQDGHFKHMPMLTAADVKEHMTFSKNLLVVLEEKEIKESWEDEPVGVVVAKEVVQDTPTEEMTSR